MSKTSQKQMCCCCCGPCCVRESFIGKETVWTGWHRRPPPRDPHDRRDRCALRCAIDPEKKKEEWCGDTICKPGDKKAPLPLSLQACQEPPYPEDFDPSLIGISKKINEGKHVDTNSDQLYAYTAVGLIGRRRDTILDNRLLQRHQVGQALRCCRDLPCESFVYGDCSVPGWKAADALRGWAGTGLKVPVVQRARSLPKTLCCKDMLATNRAALNAGIVTAAEFRNYHNTHALKFSKNSVRGGERLPPPEQDKNAMYGKKTNFFTNMKELLTDNELKDWVTCVRRCHKERTEIKKNMKPNKWKENHACTLRQIAGLKRPKDESLWKLPKFDCNAKPHLCTFRCGSGMVTSQQVGRQGDLSTGIRTKAVGDCSAVYPTKN